MQRWKKLIAGLIAFMLVFCDFAPLGASLVSFAADNSADKVEFSAQFIETEVENNSGESMQDSAEISEGESDEVLDEELGEESSEEVPEDSEAELQDGFEENVPEEKGEKRLAIEFVISVQTGGYLKNAKIELKDLEKQIFKLQDVELLGEYVQDVQNNKIKLNQINSGTEVRLYIPIEFKSEELVDVNAIQEGVLSSLSGTYVDEEGNEEIITKDAKAVMNVTNDVSLVVDSEVEKFIPYVKDGVSCALVQLRLTGYSDDQNLLPVKDSGYELLIPQIEGTQVEGVSVSAMNTGYTNGLAGSNVIFSR